MFSAHFISSKCDEYVSAPLGWEPCFLQGKFTQQSLGHPSSLDNILSERTGLPPSMQLVLSFAHARHSFWELYRLSSPQIQRNKCLNRNTSALEGATGSVPKPFTQMAPLTVCVSVCLKLAAYLSVHLCGDISLQSMLFSTLDEFET